MTSPCNICGGAVHARLYSKSGHDILRCKGCSLVFANPGADFEPRQTYGESYYNDDGTLGTYPGYERDRDILLYNFARLAEYLSGFAAGGKCLEVGSAYGFFLEVMRQRGWQVLGYEVSEYAARMAREKYGQEVRTSDFITDPIDEQYDLVCFLDSIEHLQDPSKFVERSAALLKPGGHIVATTGNVDSLFSRVCGRRWRMVEPPFHLYYFSPKTLGQLFKKHGIEVVDVKHFGKHFAADSIAKYVSRGWIKRFPKFWLYLNLFDVMTVVGRRVAA